jgi:hypothetical protein
MSATKSIPYIFDNVILVPKVATGIDMLEKMIDVYDSTIGGTWQIKYT